MAKKHKIEVGNKYVQTNIYGKYIIRIGGFVGSDYNGDRRAIIAFSDRKNDDTTSMYCIEKEDLVEMSDMEYYTLREQNTTPEALKEEARQMKIMDEKYAQLKKQGHRV